MATLKRRINISLPKQVDTFLEKIAKRDNQPIATKALELIMSALELEEDVKWDKKAQERDKKKTAFVSHKDAWL